jgi:hypothetical protein
MARRKKPVVSKQLDKLREIVERFFDVHDIRDKSREMNVVKARQMFILLIYNNYSSIYIESSLGGRSERLTYALLGTYLCMDHATAMYNKKQALIHLDFDKNFAAEYNLLKELFMEDKSVRDLLLKKEYLEDHKRRITVEIQNIEEIIRHTLEAQEYSPKSIESLLNSNNNSKFVDNE